MIFARHAVLMDEEGAQGGAAGGAASGAPAAGAAAGGAPAFDAKAATAFLTEHGVDAKSLEGLQEADLRTRYEGAKSIAEKAAAKAAEAAKKAAPGAPEKYELKAPQGVELDAAIGKEFEGVARAAGLTQENAQKVFDVGAKLAQSFQARQAEALTKLHTQWSESAKTDQEFGGAKFDENLAVAKKGMAAVATPEFVKFLEDSKLGNHPEMLRVFYRIGKAASEDRLVIGGERGAQGGDIASRLYKNTPGAK